MRRLPLASAVLVLVLSPHGASAQTVKDPSLRDLKPAPPLTLPSERRKVVCGMIVVSPDANTDYRMRQVGPLPSEQRRYSMHRVVPPACTIRNGAAPLPPRPR